MMAWWIEANAWLQLGLQGSAAPWVIALSLVLTTFLLEDVAIVAGAALAANGSIAWPEAFGAVAGGIALGDLGLYGVGMASRRVPWLHHRFIAGRPPLLKENLELRLWSAVLLARVIPGLRLVTYTLCGFARVRPWGFSLAVLIAVSVWTAGLFFLSASLGSVIAGHLQVSAPVAVALPIIAIALAFPACRWLRQRFFH
jgi:membrane protein DedA with SNARE-associated domain